MGPFGKLWTIWSDMLCILVNDPGNIAGRQWRNVPFYPAVKQRCINMSFCMELFGMHRLMFFVNQLALLR